MDLKRLGQVTTFMKIGRYVRNHFMNRFSNMTRKLTHNLYFQLFFQTTVLYFLTDLIWVTRVPICVKSPGVIIKVSTDEPLFLFVSC
jgi:hypothetical protein